jgi:hypothetical protein
MAEVSPHLLTIEVYRRLAREGRLDLPWCRQSFENADIYATAVDHLSSSWM